MNKLKIVLLTVVGIELIVLFLIFLVLKESDWPLRKFVTYDRLTVFIYSMIFLFVWDISTHIKIYRLVEVRRAINQKLITSHLIAGSLISACLAFIIAALCTDDKTVKFEFEDVLLGILVFSVSVLIGLHISIQIKDYNKQYIVQH